MEINYLHLVILMVLGVFVSREIKELRTSDYTAKHKRMGYAAYLLVVLFIFTLIFSQADFYYMAAVWVVCAPTWAYTIYHFRRLDKRKVIYTYVVVTICSIASWLVIWL